MEEKFIEHKLREIVRERGGIALKFVSPGFSGVPDRLVLMPNGKIAFVEVKAPGEKPRALQVSRHKLLRRLGFKVYVLDSMAGIQRIIEEVMTDEAS
ncbi:VRR-NUC domain-containing protein [Ruminococcus sp.]|uniref:VRR-NUC domain-containing protein n=1 Tax=Ruminococcus sp. TaxID=41978 RepID=UPI0025DB23C2|nr:VRR-NUC domain-containing protein [Ruminococcus sp.]MCR4638254.1 VRR-NUC domain-containing protein [Ruminococcus sp.]